MPCHFVGWTSWACRSAATVLLLLAALIAAAPGAWAHFQLNVNIRVLHIEHLDDGLRVYLRLPTPYVLAPLIGERRADGTVEPAPYTSNRIVEGNLFHYLDPIAIAADPIGLGRLLAAGHRLTSGGEVLQPEVEAVRVYAAAQQPPFATLEEAEAAFADAQPSYRPESVYVGDSVTDVVLFYKTAAPVYDLTVASSLDPGLPDQEKTANLIVDHLAGDSLIFRETGLLATPIEISRSPLMAALGFVKEGVVHILEGTDHVLFVLCLAIGSLKLGALLWRITGFTLGHTVTLILGFFGFVPQGAWFIPAVETGIALSIVYAGVIALLLRQGASTIAMTAALGLLHGLGFSFVLHKILNLNSPNLWQSLLSFNVGVELGQIAIVILVWPLFWGLGRFNDKGAAVARWAVVLPCIAIAAKWTGERALMVFQALSA
ncbi:MAG TPA: HupE/UreJ family protein [Kiloniellaceae bacterium]|nr:HupE/UreJ family protein [Kiloniellaceae bacterium]